MSEDLPDLGVLIRQFQSAFHSILRSKLQITDADLSQCNFTELNRMVREVLPLSAPTRDLITALIDYQQLGERGDIESESVRQGISAFDELLTEADMPTLQEMASSSVVDAPDTIGTEGSLSFTNDLPKEWKDLVLEIPKRLADRRAPFEQWDIPTPCWQARWLEAWKVIPVDERDDQAIVLLPSQDAADRLEARDCWAARVNAAGVLRRQDQSTKWARILDVPETATPGFVTLLYPPYAHDRVGAPMKVATRQALELTVAICGILSHLNDLGVRVLDLSPDWIAFRWEPALRFACLLDPTAVVPGPVLLPEWRGVQRGLGTAVRRADAEPSQVLLAGALAMSLIQNTSARMTGHAFPSGKSATLAHLSGLNELADEKPETIAISLAADLERSLSRQGSDLDAPQVAETLAWSLAEQRGDRYSTLAEFESAVRKALDGKRW